jgi:hypothetical protein
MYISRQFNARYTAFLVPNTAHILLFTLCDLWSRPYTKYFPHRIFRLQHSAECSSQAFRGIWTLQWALYCKLGAKYSAHPPLSLCELWSRSYTMHLQLRIFRLQYSAVGISTAIIHITSMQCALYCKLWAKYSAYPPVYAMWTVVPDIYNAFTAPHIQTSMFIWTYLRCYWRYLDNSIVVYCKLCAKYSAHRPVYTVLRVVPHKYNIFTAPHIQASIFKLTYLRCY